MWKRLAMAGRDRDGDGVPNRDRDGVPNRYDRDRDNDGVRDRYDLIRACSH